MSQRNLMQIVKRNGKREEIKFDKVLRRVQALSYGLKVEPVMVAQRVVAGLVDGISSKQVDNLLAETAAVLTVEHPDYGDLAARIAVSSLHKETTTFYATMKLLYKGGVISEDLIRVLRLNGQRIESMIDYDRDFRFDYFGFKTLEKGYLQRVDGKVVERPQHLYMRVALGICGEDLDAVKELYDLLSLGFYTHATPTLYNAGTRNSQMSSCYLIPVKDDSIEGIFGTVKDCALISKFSGGIGISASNVRADGSKIKGINGVSTGLTPFLKVFNETARSVNQGGRRKGAFAIYLEPWHAEIEAFLDLRKPNGKEELRARDIYTALWVPDLFMERVEQDGGWTLMSPDECPGLQDAYGDDFKALYEQYEREGRGRKTLKARELMAKIIEAQIETGTPYIGYKDAANKKSNQKNLGTIRSSNLCIEVMQFSSAQETAVCNLASLALPRFVKDGTFDHEHLGEVVQVAIRNLNRVIDLNFYPTPETRVSNFRHRPVGLGVQGLADVYFKLRLPFESAEAARINREIFETIYYFAVKETVELAKKEGSYESFHGSPASEGKLQYALWGVTPSDRYDWGALEEDVKKYGMRNSLLIAIMPTASTASVLGNNEGVEAITSNLYKRQVLSGEFVVVNKHLVAELERLGLWDRTMRDRILAAGGSIQSIETIPQDIRDIYKTVWEIKQRAIIDQAADRGPFVCQSQSMNLWFAKPTFGTINSALFYGWKRGLKTGVYYTRTKPAAEAVKVTTPSVIPEKADAKPGEAVEGIACSINNPEACEMCSA